MCFVRKVFRSHRDKSWKRAPRRAEGMIRENNPSGSLSCFGLQEGRLFFGSSSLIMAFVYFLVSAVQMCAQVSISQLS